MNERIKKPTSLLDGVPVIGGKNTPAPSTISERDQELIRQAIDEFVKVLDPIMNRMGQAITEIQQRQVQTDEIVNGALVEILAERVSKKLGLKNPNLYAKISKDYDNTHQYENNPKPKDTEEKAWDGELKHEDTESKPKEEKE